MNRHDVLDRARDAVMERGDAYGRPENVFGDIADFVNIILKYKLRADERVSAVDVALILDAVKTARIMANPEHEDSWCDKAGYAACGGEIMCDEGRPQNTRPDATSAKEYVEENYATIHEGALADIAEAERAAGYSGDDIAAFGAQAQEGEAPFRIRKFTAQKRATDV